MIYNNHNMKKIAIIIPTRDRPHKINKMNQFWLDLTDPDIETDCIIVLDEDNEDKYPRIPNFIYEVIPSTGMRGMTYPLNVAAKKYYQQYEYVGFWGDDHCPKTKGWNREMYNTLEKNKPFSMVYANDLLQCERLPTEIIMDSKFIQHLGDMVDPKLQHMYVDNYWLCIGRSIQNIHYLKDVIIEHEHYSANKSVNDDMYKTVDKMTSHDKEMYDIITNSDEFKEKITNITREIGLYLKN